MRRQLGGQSDSFCNIGVMRPKHAKASRYLGSNLVDALTHFRDLEAGIAALPSRGGQGAAFEVFVEAYFATPKRTQATEIWPEGTTRQWPRRYSTWVFCTVSGSMASTRFPAEPITPIR